MTRRKTDPKETAPQQAKQSRKPKLQAVPDLDDAEIRRQAQKLFDQQQAELAELDERSPLLPSIKKYPIAAAQIVLDRKFTKNGTPTLLFWRGEPYTYHAKQWQCQSDTSFKLLLHERLRQCRATEVTGRGVDAVERIIDYPCPAREMDEVARQLAGLTAALDDREPPLRFVPGQRDEATGAATVAAHWEPVEGRAWVATRGHVVNLETWNALPGASTFTPSCAEWEWVANPPKPARFFQYLDELGITGDRRQMLREWVGYVLSGDTWAQKGMMIIGPTRAGKSTLLALLGYLVGPELTASPTLVNLSKDFGASGLLNKKLCTITDALVASRTDVLAVVEFIKQLTGEDTISVRRKYLGDINVKLGARVMIGANEMPNLYGGTEALAKRFLFLELEKSFEDDKQDTTLQDKLRAEAAGIVKWAAGGYVDLFKRRRFIEPKESTELRAELYDTTEPLADFAAECLELDPHDPEAKASSSAIFARYTSWCEDNGNAKPLDSRMLTKRLLTHLGRGTFKTWKDGRGHRFIKGIKGVRPPKF